MKLTKIQDGEVVAIEMIKECGYGGTDIRFRILISLVCAGLILSGIGYGGMAAGMSLTSPGFKDGAMIPAEYLLRGGNVSPPLIITGIPESARSLALVVDDPDAPRGTWVHWVIYNIPRTHRIAAGTAPGTEGINDFKRRRYDGPSPPFGTHHYIFTLYALDRKLDLRPGATKQELEAALRGHILARARLVGLARKN